MPEKYERIPPLLRKRMEELAGTKHECPPEIFKRATSAQSILDRVIVWQVADDWYGGNTFDGTRIEKPETTKQRHYEDTPRGIVLSIGLGAMDALKSNGVDVGHIVHVSALSPYRRPLDDRDTKHVLVVRAGDVVDSVDLAEALDRGEVTIAEKDGVHHFVDADGKAWKPRLPWMEE